MGSQIQRQGLSALFFKVSCIFSVLEFKEMQQMSVKHCLINFMSDKFDIWSGEYTLGRSDIFNIELRIQIY